MSKVLQLAVSPDGQLIATAAAEGAPLMWRASDLALLGAVPIEGLHSAGNHSDAPSYKAANGPAINGGLDAAQNSACCSALLWIW